MVELCPWRHLSEERLKEFLTDTNNNERAPDRKIAIDYLLKNFVKIKLLDVGCGTGHQYLAMKKLLPTFEYLGVDKTQKMVDFAKRRLPGAKFIQGDIHDLQFPDRSWPIVYCRHVLAHLPGYKKALTELVNVCSDCLIICLLFPLADTTRITVVGGGDLLPKVPSGAFSKHYLNSYAREPFMKVLKEQGFDLAMGCHVEVGGYFKRFELIIARRRT